ncbi:MAG: hypothetical protein JW934_22880 [Anaerolineae bacterium]|nr:hypothetical protein [Anaerolineae bacterium]
MPDREILLKLLDEYNTALDRLRQQAQEIEASGAQARFGRRAIVNQLSYLEYRVLQLETQLSILDLNVRRPSRGRFAAEGPGNLLAQLNPWHTDFRIWAYVTALAVMMLSVIIWNIVSAYSLL